MVFAVMMAPRMMMRSRAFNGDRRQWLPAPVERAVGVSVRTFRRLSCNIAFWYWCLLEKDGLKDVGIRT